MRSGRGDGVPVGGAIWKLGNLPRRVGLLLAAVACGAGAALAQPAPAYTEGTGPQASYRVINLGPGSIAAYPRINAAGQVAFSMVSGGRAAGFFFDGADIKEIGAPGGGNVYVAGLNDAGQVAGTALNTHGLENAFVWSAGGGMVGIHGAGNGRSHGLAISKRGVVTGAFSNDPDGPARPFRWSAASGMEDLGLAPGLPWPSTGRVLNDAGLIAGVATIDDEQTHAIAWTRAGGTVAIDTLGSAESEVVAVGANGEVSGNRLASYEDGGDRPFLWTRAAGMVDLGTGRGSSAWVNAMSPGLHIAGGIGYPDGRQRAMSWTRHGGMRELGTLGGRTSVARGVNGKGQVVGFAENGAGAMRAFVWRAGSGMLDLNGAMRRAPPGLVLEHAMAINDSGAIVASSNAGLVLLRPDGGYGGGQVRGHLLGPVMAAASVRPGEQLQAKIGFVDDDHTGTRSISWSWGDGSGQAGKLREAGGAGTASASHAYASPGSFEIIVRVVDRDGRGTTVSHRVDVTDSADNKPGGESASRLALPGLGRTR